jgi:hypothetical protein
MGGWLSDEPRVLSAFSAVWVAGFCVAPKPVFESLSSAKPILADEKQLLAVLTAKNLSNWLAWFFQKSFCDPMRSRPSRFDILRPCLTFLRFGSFSQFMNSS